MRIDVVSIFPDYLAPLRLSLVGKAIETGLVELGVHDLRDWTHDRHRTVDDTPYGGGAGMVMRPEPWGRGAGRAGRRQPGPRLLVLTPSGRSFTQAIAAELAAEQHLILACGRYEGIDARVVEYAGTRMRVDELSIGDYVLNGGEAAALVVIEAVVRLLPGVIGNPESLTEESHAAEHDGLLEYPLYTKPPSWRGLDVPESCSAATTRRSPPGGASRPWPGPATAVRTCCRPSPSDGLLARFCASRCAISARHAANSGTPPIGWRENGFVRTSRPGATCEVGYPSFSSR